MFANQVADLSAVADVVITDHRVVNCNISGDGTDDEDERTTRIVRPRDLM